MPVGQHNKTRQKIQRPTNDFWLGPRKNHDQEVMGSRPKRKGVVKSLMQSNQLKLLQINPNRDLGRPRVLWKSERGRKGRHSQCVDHLLLHLLQRVEQQGQGGVMVLLLVQLGAPHRQHVLVVQVVELHGGLVVALARLLRLLA